MRNIFIVIGIVFASLVSGCSPAAPAPQTTNSAAEADVAQPAELTLPDSVDAQTAASVQNRDDVFLLDVREQWEYDEGHIPNITLIPMNDVPTRLSEIPTDKAVIVSCRSGNRSGQVVEYLRQQGYDNVHNLQGGILAWQQAGLPVEN